MKKFSIFLLCLVAVIFSYANHLKGGWIYYEYLGAGSSANTGKYKITVKQYLDCHSTEQQIDNEVYLGIFDNATNQITKKVTIPLSNTDRLNKITFNPCISYPPEVCYRIDNYETVVDLPTNSTGYSLSVQRCCRIAGIENIIGSSSLGVSYTTSIPGIINGINFRNNNSPQFAQKDTVAVCYEDQFTFDFSATDIDHDSLVYSFCPGLEGGGPGPNQARPDPPSNPPYASVPYNSGYSGSSPMGPGVTVNSQTGLISGIAPEATGDYIVAVCVSEFRSGVKIGETKKEIHITVASCKLSATALKQPGYQLCDTASFTFRNESSAANIISYAWTFGDARSGTSNASAEATPTHTYSDTGVFIIKLKVRSSAGCLDSSTSRVNVYPGFKPAFTYTGSCYKNDFTFSDKSFSRYGTINSWSWNFGDLQTTTDTSTKQNATYRYPSSGQRTAILTVSDTKGCIDTASHIVGVFDTPDLSVPFKDTLICSIDSLQLHAQGTGVFTWAPAYNITSQNTANPIVYPKDTTTYTVTLTDNGCVNSLPIKVNVLNSITVDAGADTTICGTDAIMLHPISSALQYQWSPAQSISGSSDTKDIIVRPTINTTYSVVANLGKCQATDAINIAVVPYPKANAGSDVTICYGKQTPLAGSITGTFFTWSPSGSLANSTTLTPSAGPLATTSYVLTVGDTAGCPKSVSDTVVVKVIPHVNAFAGNDTVVVVNQPLQLNASGGSIYTWSPTTGMDNPNIANPMVTLNASNDSITYRVRVGVLEGCFAEDEVKVKLFKTGPDIFIPSAFTPNHDGKNDFLKPIPVGIKNINFFKVYNRWGQLIYSEGNYGLGWDGSFGGQDQASGTYVFVAEGIDYLGKSVFKKGTVVLIR